MAKPRRQSQSSTQSNCLCGCWQPTGCGSLNGTKHFWVILGAIDKSNGGKNILCYNGEQLEHSAVLAADDDAIVNKGQ